MDDELAIKDQIDGLFEMMEQSTELFEARVSRIEEFLKDKFDDFKPAAPEKMDGGGRRRRTLKKRGRRRRTLKKRGRKKYHRKK